MSNNKFGLKNFRVFDDNGAEFEIAPITFLTGCNSSGKSSVIKALMLLQEVFEQVISDFNKGKDIRLQNYTLNFTSDNKHKLGTFDNAKNRFSKSDLITFSWSKHSIFFNDDIDVKLVFTEDKSILNNGILKSLLISYKNQNIFSMDILSSTLKLNLLIIKNLFIDFISQNHEFNRYENLLKEEINDGELVYEFINDEIRYNAFIEKNNFNNDAIEKYRKFLGLEVAKLRNYSNFMEMNLSHSSLFNLPAVERFKNLEKNEVDFALTKLLVENRISDYSKNRISLVIEDFKSSEFNTFIDYYVNRENSYLKNIEIDDFKNGSFFTRIMKGTSNNQAIYDLRDLLLLENPHDKNGEEHPDEFNIESCKFKTIYKYLLEISCLIDPNFRKDVSMFSIGSEVGFRVKEFDNFIAYFGNLIFDSILGAPSFIENSKFIGSDRILIQRLYTKDSEYEFNETLFKLAKVLDFKSVHYIPMSFTKKWINKFEIADDIVIESAIEGLGLFVYLVKGKNRYLLADEGFGVSNLIAVLFKIELTYIEYYTKLEESRNDLKITNFQTTIVIEEPESNLHPKLQSLLADMFVEVVSEQLELRKYGNYGFNFIIETHSEYLIRKLQTLVARKEIEPIDVSIVYINNPNPNKRQECKSQVEKINIKEDGRLDKPFGSGFFDEADNLAMDLLTIKLLN